jgi:hypothetical protein
MSVNFLQATYRPPTDHLQTTYKQLITYLQGHRWDVSHVWPHAWWSHGVFFHQKSDPKKHNCESNTRLHVIGHITNEGKNIDVMRQPVSSNLTILQG